MSWGEMLFLGLDKRLRKSIWPTPPDSERKSFDSFFYNQDTCQWVCIISLKQFYSMIISNILYFKSMLMHLVYALKKMVNILPMEYSSTTYSSNNTLLSLNYMPHTH